MGDKREIILLGELETNTIRHPDHLFCPICGCSEIYYWKDLDNWDDMTEEEKHKFERCPCCLYGTEDFPYEEWEDMY